MLKNLSSTLLLSNAKYLCRCSQAEQATLWNEKGKMQQDKELKGREEEESVECVSVGLWKQVS